MRVTDQAYVREQLPAIAEDSDKFRRGRLLQLTGSYGIAGCAILSARAALRTGVGYPVLLLPASVYGIVTQAVPEAVCRVYPDGDRASFLALLREELKRADALLSGCGLGKDAGWITELLLRENTKPWVLDADSLNALALRDAEGGGKAPAGRLRGAVLTPHTGEAARLLFDGEALKRPQEAQTAFLKEKEQWIRENREEALSRLTEKYAGATVLLKGPESLIGCALPSGKAQMKNPHRNPGLGRAGSGDTLAGIIGALLAQGAESFRAAAMGAWIHGEAGALARERLGVRGMLPSDVIDCIPEVLIRAEAGTGRG